MKKNIENLIVKFLTKEANSQELDLLFEWILDAENENIFNKYVEIYYKINYAMKKPDLKKIQDTLQRHIEKDRRKTKLKLLYRTMKYAAVLVIGIAITIPFFYDKTLVKVNNTSESINDNAITLEVHNGKILTIEDNEKKFLLDDESLQKVKVTEGALDYKDVAINKLIYNTLKVPNGKMYSLILSDGTKVYLNSGSSLTFPVQFLNNMNRKVELLGEAYFEVESDNQNPFLVSMSSLEVEVTGTRFNVSNYANSSSVETVLVEGKVSLKTSNENVLLKPGEKADWNIDNKKILVKKVDTKIYTAWKDGKLMFNNINFKNIRERLERHFNIEIKNYNKQLDNEFFDASFDIETIVEILESFKKSYHFNYKILDNEIIIN